LDTVKKEFKEEAKDIQYEGKDQMLGDQIEHLIKKVFEDSVRNLKENGVGKVKILQQQLEQSQEELQMKKENWVEEKQDFQSKVFSAQDELY